MADLVPCNGVLSSETLSEKLYENEEDLNKTNETGPKAADSEYFVVKVRRANSKLILQNMEEVLNSVKKKHRQKHRRKREQRKLALLEELKRAKSPTDSEKTSPADMNLNESKDCNAFPNSSSLVRQSKAAEKSQRKNCVKKPLQEQQVIEENDRGKSKRRKAIVNSDKNLHATEPDSKSGSTLPNKIQTPQKSTKHNFVKNKRDTEVPLDTSKTSETKGHVSVKQTANAFEVMMNARNKVIGSNTPGKEPNNIDSSPALTNEKTNLKIKRKLMLQSWADQKGGLKRKMDDEMRSSYVENQLEKRAKRFKKMLTSGGRPQKKSKRLNTPTTRLVMLPSTESVETAGDYQQTIDSETENFLSKLSSPTKKRDSLLGYFSKVISPKDAAATNTKPNQDEIKEQAQLHSSECETPKRRSRHTTKKLETIATPIEPENACSPQTPCGRPKRLCAGKTKYDYDFDVEISPKKGQNSQISCREKRDLNEKNQKTSKQKRSSKAEIEVINLDETVSPSDTDYVPKKLAPLFVRNVPKPSLDPQTLKARQEFLRSGVPEKLRIEQEKLKQIDRDYEDSIEIYPKLAHVHQWTLNERQLVSDLSSSNHNLNLRTEFSSENLRSLKKKLRLIDCAAKDFHVVVKKNENILPFQLLPIIGNKHQIVKTWKSNFERFPTYKCYNQLREKYRFFGALDSGQDTTQLSESFVVTRSNRRSVELVNAAGCGPRKSESLLEDDVKPPETAPNGELLFVEKYKPMIFDQVLVNLTPISQLREFLANWANGSGGNSVKNSQSMADDFIDFSNDSNSSQQIACNSVVLLGPTASGKTNAVYTLANELNFNVLEINAGMKRTGKKLIQELQEATQSHQIRKDTNGRSKTVKCKTQSGLMRLSLNDRKTKNAPSQNGNGIDACNDLETRKCLILIEDADIVFDQTDAGFTDAIYTLAARSKRPVIVVATDPNCAHLQRLMSQNTIKFSAPNALSISKYLSVLSLIENCPVSLDDLISLFLFNRQDVRRTLNELQFFIQSGGDLEALTFCKDSATNSSDGAEKSATSKYFASPSKRRVSEDAQSLLSVGNDEELKREGHSKRLQQKSNKKDGVRIHETLFEFYTVDQNEKLRIPFPIDLNLFRLNLSEIFSVAKNLKQTAPSNSDAANISTKTKQKSRSPKKTWLSTATAINTPTIPPNQNSMSSKHHDLLCSFYENLSIASLLMSSADCSLTESQDQRHDRLNPHMSEQIAHDILQQAINVNLDAERRPYNLFDAPKKKHSLCDLLGGSFSMHGKEGRSTDVEPVLRAICRSENQRALQERKSTRFYHYLRNCCVDVYNFSQQSFNAVCNVLQENNVNTTQDHQENDDTISFVAVSRQFNNQN